MNDKWRVCDGAVLGSILIFFLCLTATAQEQPPASAQVQTAVSQADAPKPPEPAPSSGAAVQTPNPSAPTPGWSFQSLSYLWFPGMNGTVGARGYTTSAHVSAADLLRNTDIGIMGAFEADHNRWGLPFDYVWAKISDSKALVNLPGYSAKVTIKQGFFTPKATYLVVDGEKVKIRATAGLRLWHLGQNLKITPPGTPSVSFGTSQNWVDGVGGANIMVPLSPKIFVMLLGDAGAGGANLDYQVAALVNYQIKPKWGIGLGYRYVEINYRNSNQVVFDTEQSGITINLLYKYGRPATTNQ
jgi:hypothetical protein